MSTSLKSAALQTVGYGSAALGLYTALAWDRWQWVVGGFVVALFLVVLDGATDVHSGERVASRVLMVTGAGSLCAGMITWLISGQWWWPPIGLVLFVGAAVVDGKTERRPTSVAAGYRR